MGDVNYAFQTAEPEYSIGKTTVKVELTHEEKRAPTKEALLKEMDELSQWENATRTVKTMLDRFQDGIWPAELDLYEGPETSNDDLWTWFMDNLGNEVIDHLAQVCLPTLMWSDATTDVYSDWQTHENRPGLTIEKGFFVVCLDDYPDTSGKFGKKFPGWTMSALWASGGWAKLVAHIEKMIRDEIHFAIKARVVEGCTPVLHKATLFSGPNLILTDQPAIGPHCAEVHRLILHVMSSGSSGYGRSLRDFDFGKGESVGPEVVKRIKDRLRPSVEELVTLVAAAAWTYTVMDWLAADVVPVQVLKVQRNYWPATSAAAEPFFDPKDAKSAEAFQAAAKRKVAEYEKRVPWSPEAIAKSFEKRTNRYKTIREDAKAFDELFKRMQKVCRYPRTLGTASGSGLGAHRFAVGIEILRSCVKKLGPDVPRVRLVVGLVVLAIAQASADSDLTVHMAQTHHAIVLIRNRCADWKLGGGTEAQSRFLEKSAILALQCCMFSIAVQRPNIRLSKSSNQNKEKEEMKRIWDLLLTIGRTCTVDGKRHDEEIEDCGQGKFQSRYTTTTSNLESLRGVKFIQGKDNTLKAFQAAAKRKVEEYEKKLSWAPEPSTTRR